MYLSNACIVLLTNNINKCIFSELSLEKVCSNALLKTTNICYKNVLKKFCKLLKGVVIICRNKLPWQ